MTRAPLTPRAPRSRIARRITLAACAAAFLAGPLAAPAAADNDLEGASPGVGARLDSVPREVRLEFDDLLGLGGATVSVTGPDGSATAGSTSVLGRTASRGLRRDLPDGRYTVSYEVRSLLGNDDGSGSYSFTIATGRGEQAPAPAPTRPRATPRPEASESAAPTPSATPTATPSVVRTKLAPAVVATAPPTRAPVASAGPPMAVPVPTVDGVSAKSREWLPPPVFWWGLIVMIGTAIWLLSKLRGDGRPKPPPPGPGPADDVLLAPPDDTTRPDGVPLQSGPVTPMTPLTTPLVPLDMPLDMPLGTPPGGTPAGPRESALRS